MRQGSQKTDAARNISFVRFSSLFFARSRRISTAVSVVTPDLEPESTASFRTQLCNVCAEPIPSFLATDSIVAHSDE